MICIVEKVIKELKYQFYLHVLAKI